MRCATLYSLFVFLGIVACLVDSTPCIKNTASPNEYKKTKKGGKDKRCIRQEAWHHEVHYHHGGQYLINTTGTLIEPDGKNFLPGKYNADDKKYKYYKIVKDKNRNDEDYGDKDDGRARNRKTTHIHDDFLLPSRNTDKRPETGKGSVNWTPRQAWKAFGSSAKRDNHAPTDGKSSISVPSERHSKRSKHEKRHAKGEVFSPPYPFAMDEVVAMKEVNVTIEQNGKDPIAINVIIRNNSKMNVTVMTRNSPVDKDAFKLGHFRVYPDETRINFAPEREGYDWYHRPKGIYSRPSDPRKEYLEEDLTHLRPNETVKQTIIIPSGNHEENEQWLKMMRHAKKIKMRVEGKWFAIGAWDKEPRWSRHVDFKYVSNTIDLEIPR
ncbi:hypothetical protein FLAG1_08950 [Fusarium langsethiae]|uniref:Uncharacterized protein n=1 Tax=Fusarium langsethiae TaxID=179993 RepID=A0A0M9ERN1_FUSLA|nr:hypothetical protein FLAG1_08950 [Fusarium langsethiae]GKU22034.1 unnamed protein product [Fusarium langsethiae]